MTIPKPTRSIKTVVKITISGERFIVLDCSCPSLECGGVAPLCYRSLMTEDQSGARPPHSREASGLMLPKSGQDSNSSLPGSHRFVVTFQRTCQQLLSKDVHRNAQTPSSVRRRVVVGSSADGRRPGST